LESRGLYLPGFDNKVRISGVEVYLSEDEMTQQVEAHKNLYSKLLPKLRETYDKLETQDEKDKVFSVLTKAVNMAANEEIKKKMLKSNNESNGEKKKRFSVFDFLK
jgi:hypothetical protein